MVRIRDASAEDVDTIRQIAEKTWWPAYGKILTAQQIRYMLDAIYAKDLLNVIITTGKQRFILLEESGVTQGFAAYSPRDEDPQIFKLHKLYVLAENHGKGYGGSLLKEVIMRLITEGIHTLDLNVNRHNKARLFYEKFGFSIIREEDVPIGPYWMNDYVMRRSI